MVEQVGCVGAGDHQYTLFNIGRNSMQFHYATKRCFIEGAQIEGL